MNAKNEFLANMAKSSEVVKSWPVWKQTVWAKSNEKSGVQTTTRGTFEREKPPAR